MTTTAAALDTFTIAEEIVVKASIEKTFDSLIANLGRLNETPDGVPLPMTLEPRPGGRWFRDFPGDDGHLWAFVQSIKRPALLELWGPLFMSNAASSNVHYRLSEIEGGTLIRFQQTLLGGFPEDMRPKFRKGWVDVLSRTRATAEA
jgi:uncharacterized protein YndB with AHSA1/START domain